MVAFLRFPVIEFCRIALKLSGGRFCSTLKLLQGVKLGWTIGSGKSAEMILKAWRTFQLKITSFLIPSVTKNRMNFEDCPSVACRITSPKTVRQWPPATRMNLGVDAVNLGCKLNFLAKLKERAETLAPVSGKDKNEKDFPWRFGVDGLHKGF